MEINNKCWNALFCHQYDKAERYFPIEMILDPYNLIMTRLLGRLPALYFSWCLFQKNIYLCLWYMDFHEKHIPHCHKHLSFIDLFMYILWEDMILKCKQTSWDCRGTSLVTLAHTCTLHGMWESGRLMYCTLLSAVLTSKEMMLSERVTLFQLFIYLLYVNEKLWLRVRVACSKCHSKEKFIVIYCIALRTDEFLWFDTLHFTIWKTDFQFTYSKFVFGWNWILW